VDPCSGSSSAFTPAANIVGQPEDPNVAIGTTLTPDGGFIAIYDLDMAIPSGLPAYGAVIRFDLSTSSGAAGATGALLVVVEDLFNGTTTTLAIRSSDAAPLSIQDVFGQVAMANLAPGTHRIRMTARQIDALGPTLTVTSGSLTIDVVRNNGLTISAPE
jgi:hypothetical protein